MKHEQLALNEHFFLTVVLSLRHGGRYKWRSTDVSFVVNDDKFLIKPEDSVHFEKLVSPEFYKRHFSLATQQ